jgi:hypothetical protein
MKGTQHRMVCPSCGKVFFAWRPDELPGAKVKCYFCGTTFEDDAAKRPPIAAPTPAAAATTPAAASSAAPAATSAATPAPAPPAGEPAAN